MSRRPAIAVVTGIAAAAVIASLLQPTGFAYAADYPSTGTDVRAFHPHTVPVFEPQVGLGSALVGGVSRTIDLGPGSDDAHSALVRVSVFEAESDVEVAITGSPALFVDAGHSGSSTLLVPVDDGSTTLSASADANARLEVLALFSADPAAAGSTVAIAEPVTRADLSAGLGLSSIGLVGLGGVPSEHVRAVWVTLTATSTSPATVMLDGKELPVGVGKTVLTTIVTPAENGDVELDTPGTLSGFTLDVRGYVADVEFGADALNGAGSYWPMVDTTASDYEVSSEEPVHLVLPSISDDGYLLALVSGTPSTDVTFIDAEVGYLGRARGLVVDPAEGTRLQLALIPATAAELTIRRGSSDVSILPLGIILGEDGGDSDGPSITLGSPTSTELDVSEHLTFDFEGEFATPGSAPLRVEVELDGSTYSTAWVATDDDSYQWHLTAAVPESGDYDFTMTVLDRDGGEETTSWSGSVSLPDTDETVVSQRAFLIGSPGHVANVVEITDESVTFDADPGVKPGDVIGAGVVPNAPEGFLRKVVAIDIVGSQWVVTTVQAKLEEAYLQLSLDTIANPDMPDPSSLELENLTSDDPDTDTESTVEILPIDELDLDPFLGEPLVSDDDALEAELASFGGHGTGSFSGRMSKPNLDQAALPSSFSKAGMTFSNTLEPSWGITHTLRFSKSLKVGPTKPLPPEGGWSGSATVAGTIAVSLKTEFAIGLRIAVEIRANISIIPLRIEVEVVRFITSMHAKAKASVDSSLGVTAALALAYSVPLMSPLKLPSITIPTPIPLVIVPTLSLNAVMRGSLTGSLDFTASRAVQLSAEFGSAYEFGTARKIAVGPSLTWTPLSITGTISRATTLEISGGVALSLAFKLWDTVGPKITGELRGGVGISSALTASATGDASLTLDPDGLSGQASLAAELATKYRVYYFLDYTVSVAMDISVPIVNITLVSLTVLSITKRVELGSQIVQSSTIELDAEVGGGGSGPPPYNPPATDPAPPLCAAFTDGSVRYVCTANEFVSAVGNSSYTAVALLQGIDRWTGTSNNPDFDGCSSASSVPVNQAITITHNLIIDSQSHTLCLYGITVSQGVTLTIYDSQWATSPGLVSSVTPPTAERPGITLDRSMLRVVSGAVNAIASGHGAGISTTYGALRVDGGTVYGAGAGGGAGIGGNSGSSGGIVTVNDGWVYADGSSYAGGTTDGAAGVGGGYRGAGGTVTVDGGTLVGAGSAGASGIGGGAYGLGASLAVSDGTVLGFAGTSASGSPTGGAGIGGGYRAPGGLVVVTGGDVSGYSGSGGAGIGGGSLSYGGSLKVAGGMVYGFSDTNAMMSGAAIGGGYQGSGGTVTVSGGWVQAFGDSVGAGAAIGGGVGGNGAAVSITGGQIDAYGGEGGGAGIGGGAGGVGPALVIQNATVNAYGGSGGAGIGGGAGGDSGPITISDSELFAYGGSDGGAGIGGGSLGDSGAITIVGSTMSSYSGTGGAGIGGGAGGDSGPISITTTDVFSSVTTSSGGSAGIGSGAGGDSAAIVISRSTATGQGGGGGAGIGSGTGGDAAAIVITESNATGLSGGGGAAIGSGKGGSIPSIFVADSTVQLNMSSGPGPEGGGAALGSGAGGLVGSISISHSSVNGAAPDGGAGIGSGIDGEVGTIDLLDVWADYLVGAAGGAGIGGGARSAAGTITISKSSLAAISGTGGAGIGSGMDGSVGTITIDDTAITQAIGGEGGAGIGAGHGGTSGSISITNGSVFAAGGGGGAAIGAAAGSAGPGITITDTAVTAVVSGAGAPLGNGAAIGGGAGGDGGTITITGGTLSVTGSDDGAGIGGGAGGDGGTITITGVASGTVAGGSNAAGIGGGKGGSGGSLSIIASVLTVIAGADATALGGGAGGNGGWVTIDADSAVTVGADPGASVVGNGVGASDFGLLIVDGVLQLDNATLVIPAGAEVTVTGAITGVLLEDPDDPLAETPAYITGFGTLHNAGIVTATVADSVVVDGTIVVVTYTPNHVDATDPDFVLRLLAPTLADGRKHVATPPVIPGWVFIGWNTSPDGTGVELFETDAIPADITVYGIWEVE